VRAYQQVKLKRLLQYLNFKDVKMAAVKGVALDDCDPSEAGGRMSSDKDSDNDNDVSDINNCIGGALVMLGGIVVEVQQINTVLCDFGFCVVFSVCVNKMVALVRHFICEFCVVLWSMTQQFTQLAFEFCVVFLISIHGRLEAAAAVETCHLIVLNNVQWICTINLLTYSI